MRVAPEEFVEIGEAALTVWVLSAGNIDESRAGQLSRIVLAGKEAAEVGVFKGIVVGE